MRQTITLAAGLVLILAAPCGESQAAAKIKPGMVTISLGSDVTTMDPHTTSSAITNTIHRYVFDTLTHRVKGEVRPQLWAAEAIRQVDPRTYEFRMREGAKFTNGEDVDAEAVKFSLLRPRTPGLRSAQVSMFRNIEGVEIVSKWVAHVRLNGPDPGFLNRLSEVGNLVPPKYYAALSQEDAAVKPVGSGPYRLVRWVKDVEMVFEANPDHWNDKLSLLKTARIVPIREDGTKVAALLGGEVNLVANIPPQHIPRLKADARTKVATDKGTRIYHLGFTHRIKSPLNDIRVRRAIAHAIDRNVIVKHVVEGYGAVANSPLHEWTEGHDPKQPWPYAYDPAKAKALLKEAGYPNGFDIDYVSPAGRYTKDKEVAEAIGGFLNAVGVRAKYQPLTWSRFVEVWRAKGRDDARPFLFYIGYGNGSGDTDRTLDAIAACKGVWSAYCSAEVDKKLDQALGAGDLAGRDRIFKSIVGHLVEDVSHVFLWQEDALYAMSRDVHWDVRNDDRVYAWEVDRRP